MILTKVDYSPFDSDGRQRHQYFEGSISFSQARRVIKLTLEARYHYSLSGLTASVVEKYLKHHNIPYEKKCTVKDSKEIGVTIYLYRSQHA